MKKYLAIILVLVMTILPIGGLQTSAAGKVVFTDQDFSTLRSGFLKDRGGAESIGAYEENHWRYWGADGLLANGDGYFVGYITYKISAPANEKVQSLKLDLVGRIGTYDDGGTTAADWIKKYWMRIYVFKETYKFDREKWPDYEDKVAVIPELTANPPGTTEEYSFDLSKWAEGGKDVYITIATYGEWSPDWIGFSHLTLSGTTAAAGTSATSSSKISKAPTSSAGSSSKSTVSVSGSQGSSDSLSSAVDISSENNSAADSESVESSDDILSIGTDTSSSDTGSVNSESGGTAKTNGSLWWIWIIAAVVVIAGGGTGFFMIKRKKK